jgi:hypothetical protein
MNSQPQSGIRCDNGAPAQPRGPSIDMPMLSLVASKSPVAPVIEDPETVALLAKVDRYMRSIEAEHTADGDLVALALQFVPLAVTADRAAALASSLDEACASDLAFELQFIAAKAAETATFDAVRSIAAAIVATPAKTLAGLVAKAVVAAWAHGCDPVSDDGNGLSDSAAMAHIVHDLLVLAAAGASIDHRALPPGPDQKLMQLRRTFDQMVAISPRIAREADARYAALVASLPLPDGLRFRLDDAPMLKRLGLDFPAGGVYADNYKGRLSTIAPKPSDEYRRAREIIDAMVARRVAHDQALADSGVQGPDEALESVLAPLESVRDEMAELIAYTLQGVAAKAVAACTAYDGQIIIDDPDQGLVQSLLADLIALAPAPVYAGPSSAGTSGGAGGLSEAPSRSA